MLVVAVDKLESPALSALVRMAQRGEPVNFRQFAVATQVSPRSAMKTRDLLKEAGLIEIEVVRKQGPTEVLAIRLTPLGERVAAFFLAGNDEMERAEDRSRR